MTSLPDPTNITAFKKLHDSDRLENLLPIFKLGPRGRVTRVNGVILYYDRKTVAFVHNPNTNDWEEVGRTERSNPTIPETTSFDDKSVAAIGDDIDTELSLYYNVKDRLRDLHPDFTIQYEIDEPGNSIEERPDPDDCPHTDIADISHRNTDLSTTVCQDCDIILDITYNDTSLDPIDTYQQDWILADTDTATQLADYPGEYTTSYAGDLVTRVDIAISIATFEAAEESPYMAVYKPGNHSAYAYYRNNELVGYLYWNDTLDTTDQPILRQMYIHPEHRGNGYATDMLESWADLHSITACYADEPNDAAINLFENTDIEMQRYRVLYGLGLIPPHLAQQ